MEHELEVKAFEPSERGPAITVELVATGVVIVVVHDMCPEVFWHLLRRPGRQLSQSLPSFTQEQFLQLPVLLQRQHVIFDRALGQGNVRKD